MSRDESFLRRWSRLKTTADAAAVAPAQAGAQSPADVAPVETGAQSPSVPEPTPLPPVESLTPESDFAPFMRGDTDPQLRATALKKLFDDPRFNVMDGLDVYIDDYSKPDPLPEGWLEKMNQVARLGIFQPKEEPAEADSARPQALEGEGAHAPLPSAETQPPDESSNEPAQAAPAAKSGI